MEQMTFDEWFEHIFPDNSEGIPNYMLSLKPQFREMMKAAWEASRENLRTWDL